MSKAQIKSAADINEVRIADATDPWLQWPDGSVVDLEEHLAGLAPGECEECPDGIFAPTINGPTSQGIERCDACDTHASDFEAALALAERIGGGVTVWYERDRRPARAGVYVAAR